MGNLQRQILMVLLDCGHTIRLDEIIYRAHDQAHEIWCPLCISEHFQQQLVRLHRRADNLIEHMDVG